MLKGLFRCTRLLFYLALPYQLWQNMDLWGPVSAKHVLSKIKGAQTKNFEIRSSKFEFSDSALSA